MQGLPCGKHKSFNVVVPKKGRQDAVLRFLERPKYLWYLITSIDDYSVLLVEARFAVDGIGQGFIECI
jgi:hypothetical protein